MALVLVSPCRPRGRNGECVPVSGPGPGLVVGRLTVTVKIEISVRIQIPVETQSRRHPPAPFPAEGQRRGRTSQSFGYKRFVHMCDREGGGGRGRCDWWGLGLLQSKPNRCAPCHPPPPRAPLLMMLRRRAMVVVMVIRMVTRTPSPKIQSSRPRSWSLLRRY